MNQAIRRTWIAAASVFVLLLSTLTYVQYIHASDLKANPWNNRQIYDTYGGPRGSILVDGREIASSVPSDDGFNYQRQYTDSELYSHLTGYFSLVYGTTGLERAMNEELSGASDAQFYDRIAQAFSGQEAQGASVELTVDPQVQRVAHDLLQGHRGAVVALDPKTGKIIAMASSPQYNANSLTLHNSSEVIENYQQLTEAPGRPLVNRAIGGDLYHPGSTFKIIDAVAALESGEYTKDSVIPNPQQLPLPGSDKTLPNYVNGSCSARTEATIEWALQESCNTPFAQIAMKLGEDRIAQTAENFGYGKDLSIPLQVTPSVFPRDLADAHLALASIGQYDVITTPLQVAMTSAAIANGGVQMKPNMVETVRSATLNTLYSFSPQQLRRSTSEEIAAQVKDWMVNDVDNGIAAAAKIPGVSVAGKTGTAETGVEGSNQAWFTGFAPADDPQVAVAIVYEDVDAVTGASLTGPGARQIFEAVLNK